ncbi:hypothetical protein [Chitinimonas sp. BJYL2]|uniref:hypothetical protein n=1 Tax=Chitinimonas sp. BJYL2 TaxID=2976696 RepID=UPI0022B3F599|nr:hypothetical protein [Chitinimonas sp. BJYL2]
MQDSRYDNATLEHIIDQATIYQCACPAQVARQMLTLRDVMAYEAQCLSRPDDALAETHRLIAQAAADAHQIMETCLEKVIDIEGWDRSNFTMPPALRERQREEVARWLGKTS